jgi:SAM-dependent methyltransferase
MLCMVVVLAAAGMVSAMARAGPYLEVGCGAGLWLTGYARRHPDRLVLGVDVDPAVLPDRPPGWSRLCGDLERLPLREASVHAIIARGVLHHVSDLEAALARLAAVLRPGGILAIRDGCPLGRARFEMMNRQLAAAGRPAEPRNGLDPGLLSQALAALGLRIRRPVFVGTSTFATPPWVPERYESAAFAVHASKLRPAGG